MLPVNMLKILINSARELGSTLKLTFRYLISQITITISSFKSGFLSSKFRNDDISAVSNLTRDFVFL